MWNWEWQWVMSFKKMMVWTLALGKCFLRKWRISAVGRAILGRDSLWGTLWMCQKEPLHLEKKGKNEAKSWVLEREAMKGTSQWDAMVSDPPKDGIWLVQEQLLQLIHIHWDEFLEENRFLLSVFAYKGSCSMAQIMSECWTSETLLLFKEVLGTFKEQRSSYFLFSYSRLSLPYRQFHN